MNCKQAGCYTNCRTTWSRLHARFSSQWIGVYNTDWYITSKLNLPTNILQDLTLKMPVPLHSMAKPF